MSSQKQIDANRRNALLSTGPKTEEGKQQSRQNALKHGLTAETVIVSSEDPATYIAFEEQILSENDPQSALEHELVLRIASLLWRLRRATLIETGLLNLYCGSSASDSGQTHLGLIQTNIRILAAHTPVQNGPCIEPASEEAARKTSSHPQSRVAAQKRLTESFLRLSQEGLTGPLERITRYEAALWRQFVQTVFALDAAKRQQFIPSRYRFRPYPPQW